jgi:photosystem II stability/assembly factor-like uncharacterized protein
LSFSNVLREDMACLAVDPSDFNRLYALGKVSLGSLLCMGAYRTTNGGRTWISTRIHNEAGSAGNVVALDPTATRTVYAGGETKGGDPLFYRSADGGATWTKLTGPFMKGIKAIAVNPRAADVIYVGTAAGLWRSKDKGASWLRCPGVASALAIVVDDGDPARVFAGGEKGVFVSGNGGASWKALGAGLKAKKVNGLIYNSALRSLFAGTDGGGVCVREI